MKTSIKYYLCIFLLFFSLESLVCAQNAEIRALQESMYLPFNSRVLGHGNAYTAWAEGAAGLFYNPAGLSFPGREIGYENLDLSNQFSRSHSQFYTKLSPFGLSFWQNKQSTIESKGTILGYGNQGQAGIGWGLNLKFLESKSKTNVESIFAVDFGTQFRINNQLRLGLMLKDMYTSDSDLKTSYRVGLAYRPFKRLRLVSDLAYQKLTGNKDDFAVFGGLDVDLSKSLAMQAGWFDQNPSLGLTLKNNVFQLQYALVIPKEDEEQRQSFGIRFGFDEPWKELSRPYTLFKQKAYAQVELGGNLVSGKSKVSLFGGQKIGVNDLLNYIHDLKDDSRCKGLILKLHNVSGGLGSLAMMQELRSEMKKLKDNNKDIIVYLSNTATLPEYYLASVANTIVMPELGTITQLGLEIEVLKTKKIFNKFGFEEKVISSGTDKAAKHPNSGPLTNDQRRNIDTMLRDLYHEVVLEIKSARKLDWAKVGNIFDGRMISGREALNLGLVDQLEYYDVFENKLKKEKKVVVTGLEDFISPNPLSTILSFRKQIAVIEVDGPIGSGESNTDILFGGSSTGSDEINRIIDQIVKSRSIKGVILRVNSPGGSMIASDHIYSGIKRLKAAKKLVYVSMGNYAASGGYYISLPADKIFASETTLTASIGVISSYSNWEGFLKWLEIDVERFSTGSKMGLFSQNKRLSEEQLKMLSAYQKHYYQAFRNLVKSHRNLDDKQLDKVAQGQVLTGKQAYENGLVDQLGNFHEVVDAMALQLNVKEPKLIYFRKDFQLRLPFFL